MSQVVRFGRKSGVGSPIVSNGFMPRATLGTVLASARARQRPRKRAHVCRHLAGKGASAHASARRGGDCLLTPALGEANWSQRAVNLV